jgi:hypothetical protein
LSPFGSQSAYADYRSLVQEENAVGDDDPIYEAADRQTFSAEECADISRKAALRMKDLIRSDHLVVVTVGTNEMSADGSFQRVRWESGRVILEGDIRSPADLERFIHEMRAAATQAFGPRNGIVTREGGDAEGGSGRPKAE